MNYIILTGIAFAFSMLKLTVITDTTAQIVLLIATAAFIYCLEVIFERRAAFRKRLAQQDATRELTPES